MIEGTIGHRRLVAQRIAGIQCTQADEVVRWLGALQGQDYRQVLWAIGLRTHSATAADIEQAIADRKILLTWPMRGTLHVVPAEDAAWMVGLSASRSLAADRRRRHQLGLDDATLARSHEMIGAALTGGKCLTRAALMQLLDDSGISPLGQRGYHILWSLAQKGLICLGPIAGKEQTFVLLDEWVPHPCRLSREEGIAELARRFFASHGPASMHDFARWTGLTLTDARAGLHAVSSDLVMSTVDGKEYWQAPNTLASPSRDASGLFLLPGFDEYLLGYKDRSDVLPAEHANKIVPGGNGIFLPLIVSDGQVVGTWKRATNKQSLDITLKPFTKLAIPPECITAEAHRYAEFLGLPLASLRCDEAWSSR